MNSFDAEMHMIRQKEMAQRAATNYLPEFHDRSSLRRPFHRRALAGLGGALVILGYRLQGEIDQLPSAAELVDSIQFSSNGQCAEC